MRHTAQQAVSATAFCLGQCPQCFLLYHSPLALALAPGVMAFIQTHQALSIPALPPRFNAVEMDMEFIGGLLQGQSLAQPDYRLGAYSYAWVWMKNTHLV